MLALITLLWPVIISRCVVFSLVLVLERVVKGASKVLMRNGPLLSPELNYLDTCFAP